MHKVLVNRLGGLSLPRKSVVRLTDRPDMTLDVYRGCKTTMQHFPFQNNSKNLDLSYKMDLDFWDCFQRGKPTSWVNFIGLIEKFEIILEMEKCCLIAEEILYFVL